MNMTKFWSARKKEYHSRRAVALAFKHFRAECPVGRMAARVSLVLALASIAKGVKA